MSTEKDTDDTHSIISPIQVSLKPFFCNTFSRKLRSIRLQVSLKPFNVCDIAKSDGTKIFHSLRCIYLLYKTKIGMIKTRGKRACIKETLYFFNKWWSNNIPVGSVETRCKTIWTRNSMSTNKENTSSNFLCGDRTNKESIHLICYGYPHVSSGHWLLRSLCNLNHLLVHWD